LLGILREENCTAAEILQQHGLRLDAIREELARSPMPVERRITHEMESELPKSGPVRYAEENCGGAVDTEYGADTVASQAALKTELNVNVWIVRKNGWIF
jgi:hypothetical protein